MNDKAWFCGFCRNRIWSDDEKRAAEREKGSPITWPPETCPDDCCSNCGSGAMTVQADDRNWQIVKESDVLDALGL